MTNVPTRRGFALLIAVATLPLVAIALLSLAALTTADARRTSAANRDAQLRQLLVAGGVAVVERATVWKDAPDVDMFDVAVPASLAEHEATVRVAVKRDGQNVVGTIDAMYAGRTTSQDVRLTRSGDRWRVVAVTLNSDE